MINYNTIFEFYTSAAAYSLRGDKMRAFVIKKSSIVCAFNYVFLAAVIVLYSVSGVYTAAMSYGRNLPIYSVETDKKQLCITFDAAWGADDTDKLIEVLKKHNAKATFFIVGQWAERFPQSVKKFSMNGHTIANHSYDHKMYTKLNNNQIMDDIAGCNELLSGITGKNPTLVRAPSGDYDKRVIKTIYSLGLYPSQWDVDSLDYTGLSKQEIVERVLSKVRNGSIVLFHNDVKNTPEALDEILSALGRDGWSFVSV